MVLAAACATAPKTDSPNNPTDSAAVAAKKKDDAAAKAKAEQAKKLAAAKQRIADAMSEVSGSTTAVAAEDVGAETFDDARAKADRLKEVLAENESLESDDAYAAQAKQAREVLEVTNSAIDSRWAEVGKDIQKERLKERVAALDTTLGALKGGTEEQVKAARDALEALGKTIEDGKSIEAKDVSYKTAATRARTKSIKAKRAIDGRALELAADAQRKKIEEAVAAVKEAVDALDTNKDPDRFDKAVGLVKAARSGIEEGKKFEKKNKTYAGFVKGANRGLDAYDKAIVAAKQRAEIATHKEKVDEAAAAVNEKITALEGATEVSAFEDATKSIEALEKVIADGAELAKKDRNHAKYLAGVSRLVPRHKATIAAKDGARQIGLLRAKLTEAKTKVDESLAALEGTLEHGKYQAAEDAVSELKKLAEGGAELGATDRGFARELAVITAGIDGQRRTIKTKRIEASQAAAAEKMTALDGEPNDAAFGEAEAALKKVESTIEAAKAFKTSDRTYARTVAVAEGKLKTDRATIARRKVEVAVASDAKGVDAAAEAVTAAMAALEGEPADEAFTAAESALKNLENEVAAGEPVAKQDKGYAVKLAGLTKAIAAHRATIARRQHEVAIARHRALVVADVEAVKGGIAELAGEPEAAKFDAANGLVEKLEKTVADGKPVGDKDKKYAAELAAITRSAAGYRAQIEKRKLEVDIAAHRATIEAKNAAIGEAITALEGKPNEDQFAAADKAVEALTKSVEGGKPLGEKDRRYAKELGVYARKAAGYTASIARRRGEVAVLLHRESIDSVASAVDAQISAMNENPTSETITAAAKAVKAYETALAAENEAVKFDRKHLGYVAAKKRLVPRYQAAIDKQKIAKEVGEHRTELTAAKTALEEKLAALEGQLDQPPYQAAENAVSSLKKAIESGMEAGSKDAGYARELAAEEARIDGYRLTIKQKWVEAASGAAKTAIEALAGEPGESEFAAAEKAVRALVSTTESARQRQTRDKKYLAFVAGAERTAKAYDAQIKRRRVEVKVAAHKAKVEAALAKVDEAMSALDGTPADSAFEDAKRTVEALTDVVASGESVANEDRGYKGYLAGISKRVAGYKAGIDSKRLAADVAAHRAKVEAATAEVNAKIEGLAEEPKDGDFDAALSSVDALEKTLTAGDEVGTRDKRYAGELAKTKRGLGSYRARIERRRLEVNVAAQTAKLEAAAAFMDEKLGALSDESKGADFDAAAAAAGDLDGVVAASAELKGKDRKFAGLVAGYAKRAAAARRRVDGARHVAAVAAHRAKIDAANEQVSSQLEAVAEDGSILDAVRAVSALESTLGEQEELVAKDKKHRFYVAGLKKRVAAYRGQIARAQVAKAVAEHRKELEAAQTAADEKMAKLEGSLEHKRYQAAENALSTLKKTTENVEGDAAKDRGYMRELGAIAASIPAKRLLIKQRRVEAADADLSAKIESLSGEEPDFAGAESALRNYKSTVEAAQQKDTKDRNYLKFIAASTRKIGIQGAAIERRKVGLEVDRHRAKVEARVAAADEKMSALEGEPSDAAFEAAIAALSDVDGEVDGGEVVAKKDRKYAGYLAGVKKKVAGLRSTIGRRRIEVDVARHAKMVEAKMAAVNERIEALAEEPKDGDFEAATRSVEDLEKTLGEGAEVAAKSKTYAKTLAGQKRSLGGFRARIARRRIEVDVGRHRARIDEATEAANAALEGLGEGQIDPADEAVTALEQALGAGTENTAKDKKHAAFVRGMQKKVAGYKNRIAGARVNAAVAAETKKVDAARAQVDEALAALEGTLEHKKYQAAEDAVSGLKRALESADETAAKSRSFAKRVASERAQVEGHRLAIRRRRVEAAQGSLTAKLEALDGEDPDFDAAEIGARDLESTIEAARRGDPKDKKYLGFLAGAEKGLKVSRGKIAAKRIDVEVTAHRAKVEEALAKANERLASLDDGASADAFDDATAAFDEVQGRIDGGEATAAKSKSYRGYLAGVRKKIAGGKAQIAKKKLGSEVAGHRAKVAAARASLDEKIEALSADQPGSGAFDAATDAVDALGSTIDGGNEVAGKSKAYAKELAGAKKSLGGYRARIARRKVEVEVATHRAKVEAASSSVEEALAALEDGKGIDAAESSISELEQVLGSVNGLGKKDKKYAAFVAKENKKARGYRATVEKAKVQAEVGKHRSALEAATAKVDESLSALEGSLEHEKYQEAEVAISGLKRVVDSAEEVAAKDRGFSRQLTAVRNGIDGQRRLIRVRRIEAAKLQMDQRLEALKEEPKEDDFEAAVAAAKVLDDTTAAAKSFKAADKKYTKYLAGIERQNASYRRLIDQRRIDMEIDANKAKVEEALAAANEKMAALDGTPDGDAFADAEAAVRTLRDRIDGGEATAAKNKKYRAYLAGLTKKAVGMEKRIGQRRIGVEVERHEKELEGALAAMNEKIEGLGDESDGAAFEAAEDAVSNLEKVIDGGADAGNKSKKYAKRLAVEKKKLGKHRGRIERKRFAISLAQNRAAFEAAQAALDEKLSALGPDSEEGAFEAATEAADALAKAAADAAPFAKRDKKYKKTVAKAAKRVPKAKRQIAGRRIQGQVNAHAAKLEAAATRVEERLAALDEEAGNAAIGDAERAVGELEETINGGQELAAKSKAHRKTIAGYAKRIGGFRATIGQTKVQGQVRNHRKELESAQASVSEAMAALDGKTKYELYRDAESAVSSLKKTAESGMELGAEDPRYGKELDGVLARVGNYRWQIRRTWIEAAEMKVTDRMGSLNGEATEGDYGEIEEAIVEFENTTEAGKKFSNEGKKYAKYLNGARKKAAGYKRRLARLRVSKELEGVREGLTKVSEAAAAAMEALVAEPNEDTIGDAEAALREAQVRVDESEPYAKKDKGFKKERARVSKQIAVGKKKIEKLRLQAKIQPHRKAVIEASSAVDERIAALAEDADESSFRSAEDAVDEYAATLDRGLGVAEDSKKYAKELKGKRKLVAKYRRRIERARARGEIGEHRGGLEKATAELEEKMAVLDGDEVSEDAVEDAVAAIDAVEDQVRTGRALGKADKAYAKELKAAARLARTQRTEVAKRGVVAAVQKVEQKMEGLQGTEPDSYADAKEAVEGLEKSIDEARGAAKKDKKLKRYLAKQRKAAKRYKKQISARQKNAVLDVHRSQVEAGRQSVAESFERIDEDPTPGAFKVASDSIDELLTVVDRGAKLAKKSKKYKKYLAKVRKEAKKQRGRIRRARLEPDLAANRKRIEDAEASIREKIASANEDPSLDTYSDALEAVKDLEEAVMDGLPLAKKNKKHKKVLKKARKAAKRYKKRINAERSDLALAPQKKRLNAAANALVEQMAGLSEAKELSDFAGAKEAADDLANVIRDNRSLAKKNKRFKKAVAKAKKLLKRSRKVINKRSLNLEKFRLKEAWASFAPHLKIAKKRPAKLDYDAAMEAAERVEDALSSNADSSNRAYKKYAKKIAKKVRAGKKKIIAGRNKALVKSQTRSLKKAMKQVTRRMKKLKRRKQGTHEPAEEALSNLERVIQEGESIEGRSKKYRKLAKKGRKKLKKSRKKFSRVTGS